MSKFEDKPLEITKPLPLADARHIYETYLAEMTRLDENDIVCKSSANSAIIQCGLRRKNCGSRLEAYYD
jgi:hypothetical protein